MSVLCERVAGLEHARSGSTLVCGEGPQGSSARQHRGEHVPTVVCKAGGGVCYKAIFDPVNPHGALQRCRVP